MDYGWEAPLPTSSPIHSDDEVEDINKNNPDESNNVPSSSQAQKQQLPSVGRDFVESRLRKAVIVKKFKNPKAGAPMDKTPPDITNAFRQSGHKLDDNNNENVYAPFQTRLDWEIARWAKLRGPGSTAMTELLKIDGFQQALGLSYKNIRELNKLIDTQIPPVQPQFQRMEFIVAQKSHILYYRDIISCIKALYGAPQFAEYLVFCPEEHYADEEMKIRLYHDMHTGQWWWFTQQEIELKTPGATIIPVILSSDKTQVTTFGGKSAYPVYMTIGNIPKDIRRKMSWNTHVLLAYLPVADIDHVTNDDSRRRMSSNLYHACMRTITEPIIEPGKMGMPMQSGDGVARRCHPIVAAYCCDYMEQIVVVGCKMFECPIGNISPDKFGDPKASCQTRDFKKVCTALESYHKNPDGYIAACTKVGIKPIIEPFWKDLPSCDIFTTIIWKKIPYLIPV